MRVAAVIIIALWGVLLSPLLVALGLLVLLEQRLARGRRLVVLGRGLALAGLYWLLASLVTLAPSVNDGGG